MARGLEQSWSPPKFRSTDWGLSFWRFRKRFGFQINMRGDIPVIDLFAGPGGLSEGFSSFKDSRGRHPFKVVLSIEKELYPHKTLELRSFFRQFTQKPVPEEYYAYLRNELSREKLFSKHPNEAQKARNIAWHATLGTTPDNEVDERIQKALKGAKTWILIGGPPCQAYSMAGRSRNGGIKETDGRADLYKEYLRIIAKFHPSIFVMENVKGLLSAQKDNSSIFQKILKDLSKPEQTQNSFIPSTNQSDLEYDIFSMVKKPNESPNRDSAFSPGDFVIRCEEYGIPQARHRIILLGVRKNLSLKEPSLLKKRKSAVLCRQILSGLPRLRGGVTETKDTSEAWITALRVMANKPWLSDLSNALKTKIQQQLSKISIPRNDRGKEFIPFDVSIGYRPRWYLDQRIQGVVNHATRAHLDDDLHRYFFAATYGLLHKKTPFLANFPAALHPLHKNVAKALDGTHFPDRFRVQLFSRPATTITSHIAKDGHYYIHPDPKQCRSLTVREAARLQTFPDNYFFEGARTDQYHQVGNAVPPLLALQIAKVVGALINDAHLKSPSKKRRRTSNLADVA